MNPSEFEERYARYLAREMDEAERVAFEQEIADSPELAEEVYADLAVHGAVQRGRVVRGPRQWWRWAAPLAAAAIILVGINLRQSTEPDPVMRGDAHRIEVVEPVGPVAAAPTHFEWTPVEDATRYRFELLDDEARVVHRTVVTSSSVDLDIDVPARGAWRVVALDDVGRELGSSAVTRFGTGS